MQTSTSSRAALATALLFAAPSCFPAPDFEAASTELHLRHVPGEDLLELLEIHRGIVAADDERAADALERLTGGWRRFPARGGWLFVVDLDETTDLGGEAPEEREFLARLLGSLEGLSVEHAGLLLDDRGRPCFYRSLRLRGAERALALLNEAVALTVRRAEEEDFARLDGETRRRLRAAAGSEHEWLRFSDAAVVLEVPMTPESAARALGAFVTNAALSDELAGAARHLERLEVDEDGAALTFAPGDDGWFRFDVEAFDGAVDQGLVAAIEARASALEDAPSLAEVRASLLGR